LRQRAGAVERVQPGRGEIGHRQIRHGDGEHGAVVAGNPLAEIRDHRSVSRFPHAQRDRFGAADGDALLDDRERARTIRRLIGIRAGEAFDEDVLAVGVGGGESPGEAFVAADHDERHARAGGAGQEPPAGQFDAREIPQDRRLEAEMRVVGEQRRAARRPLRGERPGVGRRSGQGAGLRPGRQRRQRLCRRRCQRLVGAAQAGVGRPKLLEPIRRQQGREAGAGQFHPPVAGEPEAHDLGP